MRESNVLYKVIGFVLISIIIILSFMVNDTYSQFVDSRDGYGKVIATSKKDIIADMEVYYKGDVPILRLKKGNGIDYAPVVFFSIEGKAKDYVLHINSVKLYDEVEVPIVPNINLPQALYLILSPEEAIVGEIRIKHLNEFIDESIEIKFTKDYLLRQYFLNRGLEDSNYYHFSYKGENGIIDLVKDALLYTGRYLNWETIKWDEGRNWIGEINISTEQSQLIDVIAPNLLDYHKRLYEVLDTTIGDLKAEREKNNILNEENQNLLTRIKTLEEENSKLNSHILTLQMESNPISQEDEPEDLEPTFENKEEKADLELIPELNVLLE